MSIQTYSIDRFIGLNQSGDENLMSPACTPDAANMCTDGGELRVAYGFTRLFEAAVPGTLRIDFLHFIERTVRKYRSLLREVLFMHTLKRMDTCLYLSKHALKTHIRLRTGSHQHNGLPCYRRRAARHD